MSSRMKSLRRKRRNRGISWMYIHRSLDLNLIITIRQIAFCLMSNATLDGELVWSEHAEG